MSARSLTRGWNKRSPPLIKSLFRSRVGVYVSLGQTGEERVYHRRDPKVKKQIRGVQEIEPEPMDVDTEGGSRNADMDIDIPTIMIHPPSDDDDDDEDEDMKDVFGDTQMICAAIEAQLEKEMLGRAAYRL